ncbi:unnamed protein product [Echinostoma caproni]|uniref:Uncharacterized protein n=1 Tax=Echinostoma caproni TaxID=27848 RepID=A0A183AC70_9TREM|nr:unnamed protein product [Echinostoma caproni]
MNGQTPTRSFTQPVNVAPAYSLLRDVNGHPSKADVSVGRYTAVSKSVTKTNGTTKGVYPPATGRGALGTAIASTTIEANRRSQSQQNLGRTGTVCNSMQPQTDIECTGEQEHLFAMYDSTGLEDTCVNS